MPTEWSHTAIRGLLTHHQWSVKRAKDVSEKYMKSDRRMVKMQREIQGGNNRRRRRTFGYNRKKGHSY